MTWPTLLVAFLVCHLAGDLLIQTEWQAITKVRGLGDTQGRRALAAHAFTYTVAFVPALVWVASQRSAPRAVLVGLLIAVPHLLVDEGSLVGVWLRLVKHAPNPAPSLRLMVDQSFHVVCLFGAAVVAAL